MSAQYDIAIGLNHTTLDKGVSQLYSNQDARQKLFQGDESGTNSGISYKATWNIKAAPTFNLTAPTEAIWKASINDKGVNPTSAMPTNNVFQLVFPSFEASLSLGGATPVIGTAEVIVIGQISISGNVLSIAPLSIWLDQSKMSGWDKFILDQIVLKNVLLKAEALLKGINIPPLSFSKSGITVAFTNPLAAISNGQLIMAASLQSKKTVNIDGITWPQKPLFSLVSKDVMTSVATQAVDKLGIVGEEKKGDGDYKSLIKYSYTAKLDSITEITPNTSDMTKISAKIGFGFSATADPLGIGGPCAISAATSSM